MAGIDAVREHAVTREAAGVGVKRERVPSPAAKLQEKIQTERKTAKNSEVMKRLAAPERPNYVAASDYIEKTFGAQRDKDGKKLRAPGSEDERRYTAANEVNQLYKDLIEKKFQGLSDSQKKLAREMLILGAPDQVKAVYEASPREAEKALNAIVGSGKLQEFLVKAYNKEFSGGLINDNLEQLSTQRESLGRALVDVQERLGRINDERNATSKALDEYKPQKADGSEGKIYRQLQDIEKNTPELKNQLRLLKPGMNSLGRELAGLQTAYNAAARGRDTEEMTKIMELINEKEGALGSLVDQVAEIEATLAKPEKFEQDRIKLEEQRTKSEKDREPLREQEENLLQQKAGVDAEYQHQLALRPMREEEALIAIQRIMPEAGRLYYEDEIIEADGLARAVLEKEASDAVDAGKKSVFQQCSSRWESLEIRGIKGNKTKSIKDVPLISKDYIRMVTGGPDDIIKDMVSKSGLSADEQLARLNDPEFMKEMRVVVADKLLRLRHETGKITTAEAKLIEESDWGPGALARMGESNKAIGDKLKGFTEDGTIKPESIGEALKKKSNGSILKYILLLLGTAAFGAVPIYNAAKGSLEG